MREFAFELDLCARLEAEGCLVARQLGAAVASPSSRVVDVLVVEPGPGFERRRGLTPSAIPHPLIESDIGVGRYRPWRSALSGTDPGRARAAIECGIEIGFLEAERRGGRLLVRQVARYPDWVDRLRAIENKPDLGSPGDLGAQLRFDVALGLVDEVVLATASYVTRAHLNRLPAEVGVWRVTDDDVEVVREPRPLDVGAPGLEIVDRHPGRVDFRPVTPAEKRRARRGLAERAYGKGWRTYALPGCSNAEAGTRGGVGGLPVCRWHGRLVEPASECGPACPGYEAAAAPPVDLAAERDRTSPWRADPPGAATRQSRVDRFGSNGP